jgi:hypothetical protein
LTPRSAVQKILIFVASAGLTALFFINFCATVFHCGCRAIWLGAANSCNIHMEGAHHCPWCAQNPAYALAAVVVPQAVISFWSVRCSWWKRLGAALAAFPVFGGIAAVVYGLTTGYWKT